jgi:hypothetical protein
MYSAILSKGKRPKKQSTLSIFKLLLILYYV